MRGKDTVTARKNGKDGKMVTPVGALQWLHGKKVKPEGWMRSVARAFLHSFVDLNPTNRRMIL